MSNSCTPPRAVNSIMKYLLSDTSIDRATANKTRHDRMFNLVSKKERSLYSQRNVRNITQRRREIQENWEEIIHSELNRYHHKKVICDKAALKIQKIVRGFLVRVKIEPQLLVIRERNSGNVIKDLREQTDICMLSLGTATIPAIKRIQAAYRRYLFRKKLIVMHRAYLRHLKIREEIVCNFLRSALINYSCKIKRDYLAFLEYRRMRMEQIKENIAILTVKKIWRAKKLSFKIVKEKFIRIKRRKAAMQNKEAYQRYLATLGGGGPAKKEVKKVQESGSKDSKQMDDSKKEEDNSEAEKNPEEDEEYKEAQRIKDIIERKIKEKITKGKLAYAIKDQKSSQIVLPMMQERALNEDLEIDAVQSKLFHLTNSVFAKGRSLSRESRPKTRNFSISTPKELPSRHFRDTSILFPRLSLYSPSDIAIESNSPAFIPEIENAHFLLSTVTSANKTMEPIIPSWRATYSHTPVRKNHKTFNLNVKPGEERTTRPLILKEKKPLWIPVARRFSNYVPSLDNSGYKPPVWTPVKLDKRILQTAIPSNYTRRLRNSSMSPTSVVSMGSEKLPSYTRPHYLTGFNVTSVSPSTKEQSIEISHF